MKDKIRILLEVNTDVLTLLRISSGIGWKELRESSVHRIFYLSSVLYAFMKGHNRDAYKNYNFSLSVTGPYSEVIDRSLIDLKSRELITEDDSGNLVLKIDENAKYFKTISTHKIDWFKTIIYILGLYGESKIFGFVIQDPQYKNDFQRNSQISIDISDQNKTVQTLKEFKNAFEKTLNDVSQIDDKEYLELYFEYVFAEIIKEEE